MTGVRLGWCRSVGSAVALALLFGSAAPGQQAPAAPVLWVEAPPELARQAAAVRALADGDWASIERFVGFAARSLPVRVVLATERSRLAANVPAWVSGYAISGIDTVVLFPDRVPSYPDHNLDTLLRHEITHVLLARAAGGRPVPRWFNEGTATVAAREWGVEDGARVALATIGHGPRSLDEVDASFLADRTDASRAYAISAALVRYLLRRRGDAAVGRVLAGVAAGREFPEAFAVVAGESLADFAHGYFRREALWNTWVPFLTSTTALWMAITLLALAAIKRRRERDAALREAWAAEEHDGLLGGPPQPPEDDPHRWN